MQDDKALTSSFELECIDGDPNCLVKSIRDINIGDLLAGIPDDVKLELLWDIDYVPCGVMAKGYDISDDEFLALIADRILLPVSDGDYPLVFEEIADGYVDGETMKHRPTGPFHIHRETWIDTNGHNRVSVEVSGIQDGMDVSGNTAYKVTLCRDVDLAWLLSWMRGNARVKGWDNAPGQHRKREVS